MLVTVRNNTQKSDTAQIARKLNETLSCVRKRWSAVKLAKSATFVYAPL